MCFATLLPRPPLDPYRLHAYIYKHFDIPADAERPFAYRETRDHLLVCSRIRPACRHIDVGERIQTGATLAFSLVASTTRNLRWREDDGRERSAERELTGTGPVLAWLDRQLDGAATVRPGATVHELPRLPVTKRGRRFSLPRASIAGELVVEDRSLFATRVARGLGKKGWAGCGLLVLPSLMREALAVASEDDDAAA